MGQELDPETEIGPGMDPGMGPESEIGPEMDPGSEISPKWI